ncbi:MAG: tetratricopeptide repeat protein [Candidatus Eisenbacteria bacterium]
MSARADAIIVRELEDHTWAFDYPRLTMEVFEEFHSAIETWEWGDFEAAAKSYRQLIRDYPEFIDAYHHLAILLSESDREQDAFKLWQKAVAIGMDSIPERFRMGKDLLPWGIHDNRPFLRAFHALGIEYYERDKVGEALEVFSCLLTMNPNDNQGARALAIGCNFRLKRPEDVLSICELYQDDAMAAVLYGRVLALHQLGRTAEAKESLEMAFDILPLVAQEMIKDRHRKPKDLRADCVTIGGHDEAYYYWIEEGTYWRNTAGAIDLIKDFVRAKGSRPDDGRAKPVQRRYTSLDIHYLDGFDPGSEEAEAAFDGYQEALVKRFLDSPEGKALLESDPDAGFWVESFMHYGYNYLGVPVPEIKVADVEEIVTDLFPRKIALAAAAEAEETIPELLAFWEYLRREYSLPNSGSVLEYLHKIEMDFPAIMNDPSRFGMGKSLLTQGGNAGFDMTTDQDTAAFTEFFNAREVDQPTGAIRSLGGTPSPPRSSKSGASPRKDKQQKKGKRRSAKAARKKNRKKT